MYCDYLEAKMIEKNMNIDELSKRSRIPKSTIMKYLEGIQIPTLLACKKLARVLDMDPVRIFEEIDK